MKKIVSLILVTIMILSISLLTACDDRPVLKVFNWGEYIDESVLEDFENEYGVRVIYDTFATNEEMYATSRMYLWKSQRTSLLCSLAYQARVKVH